MREASDLSAKPIMHAAPGPTFALARTYLRTTGAARDAEKVENLRAKCSAGDVCYGPKLIPAPRHLSLIAGGRET